MTRTETARPMNEELTSMKAIERHITSAKLPTFQDLMDEANQVLHTTLSPPRWWRYWSNRSFISQNVGTSTDYRMKSPIKKSTRANKMTSGLFALIAIVWSVGGILSLSLFHTGPLTTFLVACGLPLVLAVIAEMEEKSRRAKTLWDDHALDRERLALTNPNDRLLAIINHRLQRKREETIGEQSPLVKAQRELEARMERTKTFALRFNARIGKREDAAAKDALREARTRAQELLGRLVQSKEQLDDFVARLNACFDEYEVHFKSLSTDLEDRTLIIEFTKEAGAGDDLIRRVEDLIIGTTIRLQAEIATLQETASSVSLHTHALAVYKDTPSAPIRAKELESAIAEAISRLPAPPVPSI